MDLLPMAADFRSLINIVESFGDDDESEIVQEFRAWIDKSGTVHECEEDVTHAEFAYYNRAEHPDIGDDDEIEDVETGGPDLAFERAMNSGWIRVVVPMDGSEFVINFEISKTSADALVALGGLIDTHYAEAYAMDGGDGFVQVPDAKRMKSIIRRMVNGKRDRTL